MKCITMVEVQDWWMGPMTGTGGLKESNGWKECPQDMKGGRRREWRETEKKRERGDNQDKGRRKTGKAKNSRKTSWG